MKYAISLSVSVLVLETFRVILFATFLFIITWLFTVLFLICHMVFSQDLSEIYAVTKNILGKP